MPILATICHIRRGGRILLQKKRTDLWGGGKWNGPGGKLRPGETPAAGAAREVHEETGLHLEHPKFHGTLTFHFGPSQDPDWIVYVFSTSTTGGRPRASDEGDLRWFSEKHIPFDEMWPDDRYWLPLLLDGKEFEATFWFDASAERLLDHKVDIR